MQAHADLFVHEARAEGQDIGPITIVKTTLGGSRDNRIQAFATAGGFPVKLKGFKSGKLVDETIQVTSVCRALDANVDWLHLKEIFAHETETIFSNVGETGYDLSVEDQLTSNSTDTAPKSFPAKLTALLFHRFKNGAQPLLILPTELVSSNGHVLRQLVLDLSKDLGDVFKNWLDQSVTFCDTLVDRIVSEAIEPIGAIGEPYGLWAIKRVAGLREPLQHPCIVYTDDLEPYLRLKLHILNLGHSFLAEIWKTENLPAGQIVRGMLQISDIKNRLIELYDTEIIPGFADHKMEAEAKLYVATTLERFQNPFLNHRLSDIYQNHKYKIERRMIDFVEWVLAVNPLAQFPKLKIIINANSTP